MMMLQSQAWPQATPPNPTTITSTTAMNGLDVAHQSSRIARCKRKADVPDNNERLHKRMSLLNIEQQGSRLYVPVESPHAPAILSSGTQSVPWSVSSPSQLEPAAPAHNDSMQLDDSKYKVYIYNIDDELSSDSDAEDGKLVFLPDIDKHLRSQRVQPGIDSIPPYIRPNEDGELAGMQLVLYSEPSSLTVPREHDSVRKAILEARQRVREKQRDEEAVRNGLRNAPLDSMTVDDAISWQSSSEADPDAMELD